MAALTTAIVASAAIGSAAAIHSSNQQSKAIKNAGNVQKQSQDESIAFQQRARDEAKQILSKYSTEGNAARGRQNAFLGLNKPAAPAQQPIMRPQPYAGALGRPMAGGRPMQNGRYGTMEIDQFESPGMVMGGPLEMAQPGQADPTKTDAETQEEAWSAYEASPWGRIGVMEAGKARDDFLSMAGAQGSALSGRTARGMSEVAEEAKLRNFMGYYGALGDVTERGFSADTGIASGGQAFADRAANITMQGGQTAANLQIAKGQAKADGINDLASWIGWGVGQMPSGGSGGTSFGYAGSAGTSAGRARTGGFGSRVR
ncbi:MAG: hypothetical protein RIR33_3716 [Pseudomonadota bacterium]|jgi:hypothetical protein